jgi:hypothetical protein
MRQKISVEIFNYWDRIRGSADAPLRNSIEPAAIRHILPKLFILELTSASEIRFRLAGTMICNLFGQELRDERFMSLWSGAHMQDIANIASGVMANSVPILLNATGYSAGNRSLACEILLMPVRSAEDRCDRILGCIVPVIHAPWIFEDPLETLVLDRSRLMQDWSIFNNQAPLDARVPKSVYVSKESSLRGTLRRALHLQIFEGGRVD